jgi:hypothetical protein
MECQLGLPYWLMYIERDIVWTVRAVTKNAHDILTLFTHFLVLSFKSLLSYTLTPEITIQSLPAGLTHNLCSVTTLLTPTAQQYICRTSSLFNSNVHFTVLLSTAPPMYSAHNQDQTHNLCSVTTLLTPTAQQYICRTSSLFNSKVHFTSSTVNCTSNVLST